MCGCEFNFVCVSCRDRWPLDLDPYRVDWSEAELEHANADLSRIAFRETFTDAA